MHESNRHSSIAQWIGSGWYYNPNTLGMYIQSQPSSIRFIGSPIVVQEISIRPLTTNANLIIMGRRNGVEKWRKDYSSELVGSQIFAKWPGNGSVYRAKVMMIESLDAGGSIWVSWVDGDQLYRTISQEDIVSVISGNAENLYSIDEILLIPTSGGVFEIETLTVSSGPINHEESIRTIRSGGGMVFEDMVSPGAIFYSARDLILNRYKMKNVEEWRSKFAKFFRTQSISAIGIGGGGGFGGQASATHASIKRKSFRNLVLFSLSNPTVLGTVLWNLQREELILGYMNINDIFAALIDNGGITNGYEENLKFLEWIHSNDHRSTRRGILNAGDIYEGDFACILSAGGSVHVKLEILNAVPSIGDSLSVSILVSFSSDKSTGNQLVVTSEFYPKWGMLYVPPSGSDWTYPLTIFMYRANSFSVEYFGTVERVGCGSVSLSGTLLTQATRGSLGSILEDENFLKVDLAFKRFNSVLMKNRDLKEPKRLFSISAQVPPGTHSAVRPTGPRRASPPP